MVHVRPALVAYAFIFIFLSPLLSAEPSYFVLSNGTYNSNLGGLSGADAKCYTDLVNGDWMGKSNVSLAAGKVSAFLCTSSTCNTLAASTTYYFARSNVTAAGGANFTTDSQGLGPGDAVSWNGLTYFNVSSGTGWFSNRAPNTTNPTTYYSNDPADSPRFYNVAATSCSGWTSTAAGIYAGFGTAAASFNTARSRYADDNGLNFCSGVGSKPLVCIVTGDSTLPALTVHSPSNGTNSSTALNVNYSATDTYRDSCWYSNNSLSTNVTLSACSNFTTAGWADGFHTVFVFVNDTAGYLNSSTVTFRIDSLAPASIDAASGTLVNNSNTSVTYAFVNYTFIEDNAANCTLQFDPGSGTSANYSATLVANATGGYCFYNLTAAFGSSGAHANYTLFVTDGAGNSANSGLSHMNFDNDTPSVSLSSPSESAALSNAPAFSFTYSDPVFTGGTCSLYVDGVLKSTAYNVTATGTLTASSVLSGPHTWWIHCVDHAGNAATNSTRTFSISSLSGTAATPTPSLTIAPPSEPTASPLPVLESPSIPSAPAAAPEPAELPVATATPSPLPATPSPSATIPPTLQPSAVAPAASVTDVWIPVVFVLILASLGLLVLRKP